MMTPQAVDALLQEVIAIGLALSNERDLEALFELILSRARQITRAEAGTLFIREGEILRFAVVQNDPLEKRLGAAEMKHRLTAEPLPLATPSLAGYVARSGRPLNIPDASRIPLDGAYQFNPDVDRRVQYCSTSFLVVPLTEPSGRITGVLQLINALDENEQPTPFDPEYDRIIELLASHAAVALRNAQLQEMSFKDALTDVYNRRYVELRLAEELSRYERTGVPLSVVMFDLDQFKRLNDSLGHVGADVVLREVAQVLVNQSRQYTVVARYGGDEFVSLLPNTSKTAALAYAQRLRRIIERYPFPQCRITASVGLAGVPDDATTADILLQAVDAALYRAKKNGRNIVAVA